MSSNLPAVTTSVLSDEALAVESLTARTNRILADPNLLDIICSNIASGGSLHNLAKMWAVRYGDISNWINSDLERSRRFKAASDHRLELAMEQLISEIKMIAFSDARECFSADGSLKAPSEWPESVSKAISSVDVVELFDGSGKDKVQIGYTKKIRMWDKTKMLETMARMMGMFVDRVHHTGELKLEDLVVGSYKDASKEE